MEAPITRALLTYLRSKPGAAIRLLSALPEMPRSLRAA